MSTTTQQSSSGSVRPSILRLPPLQTGDHLTAEEFERRFDAMPELKKAELIEGVVYVGSPVSTDEHGEPHAGMLTWLGFYGAYTPGTQTAADSTVRLDKKNVPQPDVFLRILPAFGGRTKSVGGYVVGGPELTTEVSATTVSFDLHTKLKVYWRNGVQEYVVWRVWDREIDWFVRGDKQFERLPPENGICKSQVFPGLWLDVAPMIDGNMAQALAVLQQGLATPEHAAFRAKLSQAAANAATPHA